MGRYGKSRHGRARRKPSDARRCNRDPDCTTLVIVAILAPTPAGQERRWAAFEARDREPNSAGSVGCRVIVGRQAWRPADLVEDYTQRHPTATDEEARNFVAGYPWHRIHIHERPAVEQQPDPDPTTMRSTT